MSALDRHQNRPPWISFGGVGVKSRFGYLGGFDVVFLPDLGFFFCVLMGRSPLTLFFSSPSTSILCVLRVKNYTHILLYMWTGNLHQPLVKPHPLFATQNNIIPLCWLFFYFLFALSSLFSFFFRTGNGFHESRQERKGIRLR